MKVRLTRRHGSNPAGTTVDYTDPGIAQWVIDHGYGTREAEDKTEDDDTNAPASSTTAATRRRRSTREQRDR